ncbi:hypothetical protein E1A91_A07G080500v1 [Gossypium mustelinum]|uniref:Uncharacterized protein n=1 Tax=Gossypium mustelinum TaxID=34275 RepID=A0A5D2YLE4_GOSMU|nr:hypothetical protein E1A91_A07G080500v1 [Gossypium mustelinum]TYJ25901.1 hypothetical protein E1A91_A07G080500v1 [Gossypium mustelinum]TYJ25902.1 hypothetical protein E1A91_A07G080500v1 [Gossypium mustelinum]TYJ25903.1 hypothetical protein E1A91_A07G080500v1 [Gossypium mustelinum]
MEREQVVVLPWQLVAEGRGLYDGFITIISDRLHHFCKFLHEEDQANWFSKC